MGRVDINRATAISHSDLIGEAAALKRKIQESATEALSRVNALRDDLAPAAFSGDYADLENTPALSPVATSGAYADLTGKPTLGALASLDSITTAKISNWSSATSSFLTASSLAPYAKTADLATVATTGAYSDLSGKPTIPTVPTNVSAFNNDVGYLTQHQSLTAYAKTADLGDLAFLDTLTTAKISNWATATSSFLTSHQDISGKQDVLETESVAITLPEVTELTTHNLYCYRYGNVVMVYVGVTLSAALSSAVTVATGLPAPARELYQVINTWASSYRRPIRAHLTAGGNLTFQYGYATSYNHVLAYLAA